MQFSISYASNLKYHTVFNLQITGALFHVTSLLSLHENFNVGQRFETISIALK